MKKQAEQYLIIGVLILLYSCSCLLMTKEAYLNDYKDFITEVSNENSTYTENDWKDADEKFHKYSVECYNRFKDEILWKEQIVLYKYKAQYNLYKYKEDIKNMLLKNNELKSAVKCYAENNMTYDIDF